jgi:hypothetical protein
MAVKTKTASHNHMISNYAGKHKRGIAVYTTGENLTIGHNQPNRLRTAHWPCNTERVGIGDGIIVYHRHGSAPTNASTVYVGTITGIQRKPNGLCVYEAANVEVAANLQNVNWIVFSGSRSRVRYF